MKLFNKSKTKFNLTNAIIVGDGNSLTYGYLSSNPTTKSYTAVLDADTDFNGCTFYNFGVSAQTTQDMIDDAVSQVDAVYSGSVTSILIAWEVGNDIYFNGSVSAAMTRFWSYCDSRKSAGWKVYVVTCTPRDQSTTFGDNSSQYNVKLADANAFIKSDYATHADGVIDLADDIRFQGYNLTYYNADKVHFTDAGYAAVAEIVKRAIK
jgi:hypothetical protein